MKKGIFYLMMLCLTVSCQPGAAVESQADNDVVVDQATIVTTEKQAGWMSAWLMNETGEMSAVFEGVAVDVTAVYVKTVAGVAYQCIQASGIPSYASVVDQAMLNGLNSRPQTTTDFGAGGADLTVGDLINFGEDIGYEPQFGCTDQDDGRGYWPPGPACPANQNKDWCFPLEPQPIAAGESCETGLNQIGAYINGVSIFNWQDGQSYNNENVWVNDAFHFEIYDLDICVGHSAGGNYHHHSNPTCLGEQLGDDGSSASPIYGFAADGYPIYGPWEAAGVLAQSCWVTRDYETAASPTGCGGGGERSCLLVDQYDVSRGSMAARQGPSTNEIITSMSGNPIPAVSGVYFQDYYYDAGCTGLGNEYLDEHNGHQTAELGYHYHATLVETADGTVDYAFPYYAGPTYAAVLADNGIAQCGGGMMGGGPPMLGAPPGEGNRNEPPDLAAAAASLGITEEALRDALGAPPPNFEEAAAKLGISVEALQEVLGGPRP